jgi:pilus assembly protein CpaE
LTDLRGGLKGFAGAAELPSHTLKLGIVSAALTQGQASSMGALFAGIRFEFLGENLRDIPPDLDILFVSVDGAAPEKIEQAVRQCKLHPAALRTVFVLHQAELSNTRALLQSGAVDVLPAPVGETALALCLERLVARGRPGLGASRPAGQLVAVLKAGGGVGATSLAVQAGLMAAVRVGRAGNVCFADLDLQFGSAALYLDMAEALTVSDCLAVGEVLGDTQFATALAAHRSGMRLLAAPRDVTALDALTPQQTDSLLTALRRDFTLTIADLPPVWTPWTYRALQMAARIVLVTRLSVPHVHLVRRQLNLLGLQKLDAVPLTLICNAVNNDRQNMLPVREAERAIGRAFDIVIPEESRVMEAACNQGLDIAAVRRGTKLEKMTALLADRMTADALTFPVPKLR